MIDSMIQFADQYGYLIFFLAFCLGPFGIPIPNEITILTGSLLSSNGTLNPWMVYFAILAGLLTAISLAYWGGRLFGRTFRTKLQRNRYFSKTEKLFLKHGNMAMCIGFFIPVVRYMMPLFVGLSNIPYKRFALVSYAGAVAWTVLFFIVGLHIQNIIMALDSKTTLLIILIVTSFGAYALRKIRSKLRNPSLYKPMSKYET